jgi:hypothetical protein
MTLLCRQRVQRDIWIPKHAPTVFKDSHGAQEVDVWAVGFH